MTLCRIRVWGRMQTERVRVEEENLAREKRGGVFVLAEN